jgi:hypothetical protein
MEAPFEFGQGQEGAAEKCYGFDDFWEQHVTQGTYDVNEIVQENGSNGKWKVSRCVNW